MPPLARKVELPGNHIQLQKCGRGCVYPPVRILSAKMFDLARLNVKITTHLRKLKTKSAEADFA
jgi:hypothetical protein